MSQSPKNENKHCLLTVHTAPGSIPTTTKNKTKATNTETLLKKKKDLVILGAFMEGNNYPESKKSCLLRQTVEEVSVSPQSPFLLSLLSFTCPHLTRIPCPLPTHEGLSLPESSSPTVLYWLVCCPLTQARVLWEEELQLRKCFYQTGR